MAYPSDWHVTYGDKTGDSARAILPGVLARFAARSTLEVGCGNAHWTQAAIDSGIGDYAVTDGPWNDRDALLVDRAHFTQADLAQPLRLGRRFDLAICLEVAEHVPATSETTLVASLIAATDVILFGAAIPFQGGYGHINERWQSHWAALFDAQGYEAFDLVRPLHWANRSIHYWYRQNTLVYVNRANGAAMAQARGAGYGSPVACMDLVHPEKFEETASYSSIAGMRLMRRLPGWALGRIRSKLRGKG